IAIVHALLCLDGVETMRNDALSGVASLAPGSRLGASSRLFAAFAFWLSGEADEAEAWLVEALDVAAGLGADVSASIAAAPLARLQLGLANAARARELCDEIDEILVKQPSLGIVAERSRRLRRDLDAGRSEDGTWAGLLTPAELRLVPLLASHLSFREIALRLDISRNTVKTQAIAVYRKLNVSSRSDA